MSNKLKKTGTNQTNKSMEEIKKSNDILKKEVSELIDAEVEKRVAVEREVVKIKMMSVMFGIPVMVLKEHYWKKTYSNSDKLPTFVDHMLRYYEKWDNGLLSTEKIEDVLWKDAGIQFDKDAGSDWENAKES